jgi:RNA polymerase sigma-70 factor, ECF subfamily
VNSLNRLAVSSASDEELIRCIRAGSRSCPLARASVNELFQRYQARVVAWCTRTTGDREAALDLAQEVFLMAYRYLDSFQGNSKFPTWLFTIARNRCLTYLKARATAPAQLGEPLKYDLPDHNAPDPDDQLERDASIRAMRRTMAENLEDLEIQVMTMHYADEVPIDAITRMLGLKNASGAKAYIVSAKRKLTSVNGRPHVQSRVKPLGVAEQTAR